MSKKKKKNRTEPETLGLPLTGVDSHAHLDSKNLIPELDVLLARARACGVARIGNVFLGPEAYRKNRSLFDDRPEVFFLLGVHPNDTENFGQQDLDGMRAAFAQDDRLKAVGEIGLDYYWERVPHAVQQDAFRRQLELAAELDLPPVIHSRDADADTIRLLEEEGYAGKKLLWHCFGGDWDMARTILDNGWHISIPGPVTYKANEALQKAVTAIPLDRLLLETDCPYLTPEPWRGKTNHPALATFTARKIAQLRSMDTAELWEATGKTAMEFFGL